MLFNKTYNFNKKDYIKNDDNIILDYIRDCELDFHNQALIFYANYLFANNSTMLLLKNSFYFDELEEDYGVELITGDFDYDFDTYCEPGTIVAINTYYSLDEPLFLIIDNKMKNGIFTLKYLPYDDDERDEMKEPEIPIKKKSKRKKSEKRRQKVY